MARAERKIQGSIDPSSCLYVGHRTGEVLSRLITEFKFEDMDDAFKNLFSKLANHHR